MRPALFALNVALWAVAGVGATMTRYTNSELHMKASYVGSSMDATETHHFETVCKDFIHRNLIMPTFDVSSFEVKVTGQSLTLTSPPTTNEHLRKRELQSNVRGELEINTIVTVVYTHPDDASVDPLDFHRYLRLLINTRGRDLVSELKLFGNSFFMNLGTVATTTSTIKNEDMDNSQSGESDTESGGGDGVNVWVALLSTFVASTTVVIAFLAVQLYLNQRRDGTQKSSMALILSPYKASPFTHEELSEILGQQSRSKDFTEEQSKKTDTKSTITGTSDVTKVTKNGKYTTDAANKTHEPVSKTGSAAEKKAAKDSNAPFDEDSELIEAMEQALGNQQQHSNTSLNFRREDNEVTARIPPAVPFTRTTTMDSASFLLDECLKSVDLLEEGSTVKATRASTAKVEDEVDDIETRLNYGSDQNPFVLKAEVQDGTVSSISESDSSDGSDTSSKDTTRTP